MSLIAYTITALELNQSDATASGKQVVVGASCSMYIQPADTAVLLYDNAAGSNGSTAKSTGADGQVTVYIESGDYRVSTNSVSRYITVTSLASLPTFGTAATQDVTTNKQDTTEGRLLKVGDYGLGLIGLSLQSTDLDAFVLGGTASFYTNTTTNTPVAGTYGVQWYSALSTEAGGAMAVSTSTQSAYFRSRNSSSFNPWYEFYHSNNTNFNVFGDRQGSIFTATAKGTTTLRGFIPISSLTQATSITIEAGSTFEVRDVSGNSIGFATLLFNGSSTSKVCVIDVTVSSGLTAGLTYDVRTATSASKFTVNF